MLFRFHLSSFDLWRVSAWDSPLGSLLIVYRRDILGWCHRVMQLIMGHWKTTLRRLSLAGPMHRVTPWSAVTIGWYSIHGDLIFLFFRLWQDYMSISHCICRLWIVCIIFLHWRFTDFICYSVLMCIWSIKGIGLGRFIEKSNDWLPMNCPWLITYDDANDYCVKGSFCVQARIMRDGVACNQVTSPLVTWPRT